MSSADNWRDLYPFGSHYLTLDNVRMHYVDEGTGPPLLLVHGNPTWSFYWRQIIAEFRKSYRVIAVDHVGCGLSDKPQQYPYRLSTHIANLSRLIRSLELEQATLVAHDWGGAIGSGALLENRARFASLVLLNTGAFPPPFVPWRIRACRIPVIGTWAIRRWNLFARAALRMAVADPRNLTQDAKAGLLAPYDSWQHRVAIDHFVKDIPRSPREPTWQTLADLERGLAELSDWPVALIWGMRDWCFRPSCLERFRKIFPQAEVHRLETASHYVLEDAPREVIEALRRFLASVYGTSSGSSEMPESGESQAEGRH